MNFDEAFNRVIGLEKGYVNDPDDPGGETNFGISKRSYPHLDIKHISRDEAKAIYFRDFWNRIGAGDLPDGVVYQVFDFAVNSSIETAIRYLQRSIGVADDGYWGPISKNVAKQKTESDMIMNFVAERLIYYTKLKRWDTYSKGWTRRAAQDLKYGAIDS
jgi:lysozyme family protein